MEVKYDFKIDNKYLKLNIDQYIDCVIAEQDIQIALNYLQDALKSQHLFKKTFILSEKEDLIKHNLLYPLYLSIADIDEVYYIARKYEYFSWGWELHGSIKRNQKYFYFIIKANKLLKNDFENEENKVYLFYFVTMDDRLFRMIDWEYRIRKDGGLIDLPKDILQIYYDNRNDNKRQFALDIINKGLNNCEHIMKFCKICTACKDDVNLRNIVYNSDQYILGDSKTHELNYDNRISRNILMCHCPYLFNFENKFEIRIPPREKEKWNILELRSLSKNIFNNIQNIYMCYNSSLQKERYTVGVKLKIHIETILKVKYKNKSVYVNIRAWPDLKDYTKLYGILFITESIELLASLAIDYYKRCRDNLSTKGLIKNIKNTDNILICEYLQCCLYSFKNDLSWYEYSRLNKREDI